MMNASIRQVIAVIEQIGRTRHNHIIIFVYPSYDPARDRRLSVMITSDGHDMKPWESIPYFAST
jgi:hypothetical protein